MTYRLPLLLAVCACTLITAAAGADEAPVLTPTVTEQLTSLGPAIRDGALGPGIRLASLTVEPRRITIQIQPTEGPELAYQLTAPTGEPAEWVTPWFTFGGPDVHKVALQALVAERLAASPWTMPAAAVRVSEEPPPTEKKAPPSKSIGWAGVAAIGAVLGLILALFVGGRGDEATGDEATSE